MDETQARIIACDVLRGTEEAMLNRDAETFASYFALPQKLETLNGPKPIGSRDELIETFYEVVDFQRKRGIDGMVRRCVEASFKSEDLIEYVYESRFFSGARELSGRRTSYAMIQREGDVWKIVYTLYGVESLSDLAAGPDGPLRAA
ncbi:hypothetical protein ABMC89_08240 [Sulfitobacter sp. HNIBRBA3233]|uniref:hypothetical protein n=1 Tax=Sulfitobacter marinivivus TaxID=3158558 RepID=UPI0032DFF735